MRFILCFTASVILGSTVHAQDEDFSKQAQAFRNGRPVPPMNETTLVAEAEEFKVIKPGWEAKPFGTNYFAATFANSFLSRKAYLSAPEECEATEATIQVTIPRAGRYLALIRYEATYRFENQFTLTVEQNGAKKLDRLYGSRDNLRIWAFREKLKKEVAWSWGAVENVVWEGHDAFVDLAPGVATLTLKAGKQKGQGAKRNVDLVMLTSDVEQVKMRIEKENYLPLDGMLTQAGDVHVKVSNTGSVPFKLTIPNGTEHSPYWIHIRNWKPVTLDLKGGEKTEWVEVGSVLDTLSDGQWTWNVTSKGKPTFDLEFGLKDADGKVVSLRKISGVPLVEHKGGGYTLPLTYDADTRYSRRVRLQEEILYQLVDYLKKHPIKGAGPRQTLIYGYTFAARPEDPKYTAALNEFIKLMGATALERNQVEDGDTGGMVKGYIDVRSIPTPKLEDHLRKLKTPLDKIAVVSLGDEIGLAAPAVKNQSEFHAFLKGRGLKAEQVDPVSKGDWSKVLYTAKLDKDRPEIFYYSRLYAFHHGIQDLKARTDILKRLLPNAGIGANFSPHHSHLYLGETHMWISLFRKGGMTMPWGEDYIWQVPVGTLQMNLIMVDMFRCAIKGQKDGKIHYYVMPHTPGNTTASWRRQFYGDVSRGVKQFNLFEFRPVQFAYTENHVSAPSMYQEIRKSLHELATFEDILQEGQLTQTDTALWTSDTADIWNNHKAPFDAAKRTLYVMLRQLNRPLDFVLEGDDLKPYQTLVLCDANVSRAGSKQIVEFVKSGGNLLVTAGGGMFDEFNRPNEILRGLLGVAESKLEVDANPVKMEKQDLPFATPLAKITIKQGGAKEFPIFGAVDRVKLTKDAVMADGGLSYRQEGKGKAWYCTYLPGLSYFHPALPKKPVDRGSTDDSMAHFLPTNFDLPVAEQFSVHLPARKQRVLVSERLIDHTLIQSKKGAIIPLVHWGPGTAKGVRVTIPASLKLPTDRVTLASGRPVQLQPEGETMTAILDLDVADVLIFRSK